MDAHRAYAVLQIKDFDQETRTIRGIATTPTPDRMDDIVEPRGAKFTNPLPLLLFHDTKRPVGTVTFDPPTDQGITFSAQIARIADAGPLRDRVDEAWQSIKAGLIKGVSIGFRPLKGGIELMKGGGLRFKAFELYELSLVTVPANADATIQGIKSLDAPYLAASGSGTRVPSSPGVTGSSQERTMRTIQQQIDAKLATRKPLAAKMAELMDPVIKDDAQLSEAEQTEYDGLTKSVADLDTDIVRLEALERSQSNAAAPIIRGNTFRNNVARPVAGIALNTERNLPPGIEFAQAMICKMASAIAVRKGEFKSALDFAKERYPDNDAIALFLKGPIAAGNTTDSTWAEPLVATAQTLVASFLDYLRPRTIIGQFGTNGIPALNRVPFNIRYQSQTSGGAADWVGEGRAKPLTKFDFDADILRWAKVATIAVITQELARFSSPSAEERVRNALTGAVVEKLDRDFIDPDKAANPNVSPGSITNGIAALTSSGNDAVDIRTDIAALLATFINANNNPTSAVWIMPSTIAMNLGLMRNALGQREFPDITMRGGSLEGIPVIASQYAAIGSPANNLVILVNAGDIFLADDGGVTIDVSMEASLEMADDPTNGGSPTETTLVSLWQDNLIGLRAERFINWARGRESAVAYMEEVGWTAAGSPV